MSKKSCFFAIAIWCAFLLGMNVCYSFCGDDGVYGGQMISDGVAGSIVDLLCRAFMYTKDNPYRPLAHFFTRLFASSYWGKWFFDVCNASMMVFLTLLIAKCALGRFYIGTCRLIFLVGLVFCFLCHGECYLFCAGSCNYLWSGVATLLFWLIAKRVEQGGVSIGLTCIYALCAIFLGAWQESFALPMCFALGVYSLLNIRRLDGSKVVVYGAYAVGAFLLVLTAYWRMEAKPPITLISFAKSTARVLMNAKLAWVVFLMVIFSKDRKAFWARNGFEMLVIASSMLMMAYVGYCGERSIWISTIMSIIIIVREFEPSIPVVMGVSVFLMALFVCCLILGVRIKVKFYEFVKTLEESSDGVTCYEQVDCGPFERFFYHDPYRWTPDVHERAACLYYGKGKRMVALDRDLYERLYLQDAICVPENKLQIPGEFYTTRAINAIVMPLRDDELEDNDASKVRFVHHYAYPKGLKVKLNRMRMRHNPRFVALSCPANVLVTNHGRYLLIPKELGGDAYLKKLDVTFDRK